MPRLLDLFAGRFGWSRAFVARGWECVGIDLTEPPEILDGCEFIQGDILTLEITRPRRGDMRIMTNRGGYTFDKPDFICASSPCEQFSVHGMKHFHPNPPYPELGIELFNHTRAICEASGVPYVMENVRAAQQFVGQAVNHCGPFYLWGNAVPPLMPYGITKGIDWGSSKDINAMTEQAEKRAYRDKPYFYNRDFSTSEERKNRVARAATIPPELANCVADYAGAILRQEVSACFVSRRFEKLAQSGKCGAIGSPTP